MHIDGAQGCAESAEPGADSAAQPASMLGKAPLGQICRQFQARIVTDAALLHQTLHAGRHARNRASDHHLHVLQIDAARVYARWLPVECEQPCNCRYVHAVT